MKNKTKVFALMSVCTLVLSSLPVNASYSGKGCHHDRDHSCFRDDTFHYCDHYIDDNNDGYCDHCYRVNNDPTINDDDTTVVSTTYNNGYTNNYGGHHHGQHHGITIVING